MAKKTHKEDSKEKPFIDYEQEAVDNEPAKQWTTVDLQHHWRKLLLVHHHAGGYLWSVKNATLLRRLITEFSPEAVSDMMEWWIKNKSAKDAFDFPKFYWYRFELRNKLKEEKEGWKWS